jgi:drug/metabolite transporter (DMT)-like permease
VRVRSQASTVGIAAGLLAMAAWAASGVMAKGIDLPGMTIILYRMWLYVAVVLVWLALRHGRLSWTVLKVAAPGGIALGLDIALFFNAVKTTTIANATVIAALQPALMLVLAARFFGEKYRRVDVMLCFVALAGVAVVVFGSAGLPDAGGWGDLMAVGSLFAWTAYFAFSKATQRQVSPLQYTAATAVWAAVVNTPIAFASGQDLSWPSAEHWFWLGLLALVPGLIGHGLMNWSLTRIPVWLGGTLTLAIPVTSTLLAWAFIDEEVRAVQFVGMAIVIGALAAIVTSSSNSAPGDTVEHVEPIDGRAPPAAAPDLPAAAPDPPVATPAPRAAAPAPSAAPTPTAAPGS